MNDVTILWGAFICGAMFLLMVAGLVVVAVMPPADRWSKRYFTILFTILLLGIIAYLIEGISYIDPFMAAAGKPAIFFESLFVSIPIPMFTGYLLHCCGEKRKSSVLFITVLFLWILYAILVGIAQFTTDFYYIAPDNQFQIGKWYPLPIALLILIMTLNLAGVIRRRKKVTKKNFYAFLLFLLPLISALIVHIFRPDFLILDICIGISVFSMFIIILSDYRERQLELQQETIRQKASITVLQMRPHFIYNTMMSIYYLCSQDAEKAKQVTLDFTTYLRKNFTAIARDGTIPFSEELEHTRAYLAVEQASYEDDLIVEYDTPHIRFHIPPLTLQPIVENAVKHGMDPDLPPLCIAIRTRETKDGSEIIVEDNGPGFEPAEDAEPYFALSNIKQRLEMMCHGRMITTPREGGGTVVKVIIP